MATFVAPPVANGVTSLPATARFPLLDPAADYDPNTFDYNSTTPGQPGRAQWINVFRKSIPEFTRKAAADPAVDASTRQAAAAGFAADFEVVLQLLEADPLAAIPGYGSAPLNCVRLCSVRDACLRARGFEDPFRQVKQDEDAKALALLPAVLRDLDGITNDTKRMELALRGVFAGNIFDLGAAESIALFNAEGGVSFHKTRDSLVARPWVIDDLDAALEYFRRSAPRKAVMFCDNAGSDVILGMLPLARELLKRGVTVVMAANERPSINDTTAAELSGAVQSAAEGDKQLGRALDEQALSVMSSGSDMPVIDLSRVSPALSSACADCDLVILEGMGRAIETNLYARFTCHAVRLGMIKHPEVAQCLKGRLYDVVCRFT